MKQVQWVVASLFLFLGFAVFSSAQDLSMQYYQAGNTYYSQKNYDYAIRYYQGAVQGNPNFWQAYQGMGNCYYAKGDKATALTNYQKALSINPNNPSLTPFVQSLQAQMGTPPPPVANNSMAASPGVSAPSSNKFELDIHAGVGVSSIIGFGGGVDGFVPLDKSFAIGAMTGFYTFGSSASGSGGGVTATASASTNFLEFLASAKYRLEGTNMKPYFIGGVGIADYMVSASYSGGGGGVTVAGSTGTYSQIDPMVSIGGGLEFPAGKDMNFFAQAKYSIVIVPGVSQTVSNGAGGTTTITSGGGTATYLPVEAGLNFNL